VYVQQSVLAAVQVEQKLQEQVFLWGLLEASLRSKVSNMQVGIDVCHTSASS
jgi:hypothetical protein